MSAKRIDSRSLMWALDYIKAMVANLEKGSTVIRFSLGEEGDPGCIEFEIVVTKLGNKRLPRVASPLAQASTKPVKES